MRDYSALAAGKTALLQRIGRIAYSFPAVMALRIDPDNQCVVCGSTRLVLQAKVALARLENAGSNPARTFL